MSENEWRDAGGTFYGGHKMIHIPCGTEVIIPAGYEEHVLMDCGPICPKCQRGFAANT